MLPFWLDVSISHLCHENENNIKLFSICIAFSPYFHRYCCYAVHTTNVQAVIFHGWHIKFKWQQKQNRTISLHSPIYHRCERSNLMIFYPFSMEFAIIFFYSINYENDPWCQAAYIIRTEGVGFSFGRTNHFSLSTLIFL